MRKTICLLITVAFSTLFTHAQEEPPHVSVFGTAVTEVVPNEMHWTLNIVTREQQVATVAEVHDKKVAGVIAFLKDHGVVEKRIRTSRITLSENWIYRDRNRVKDGYVGNTTITFEHDDLDKYRDLWIGLSKLQDVSVNGVTFDTSDRIKYQHTTRVRAVQNAQKKAQDLAGALDARIGEPLLISENLSAVERPAPSMMRNSVAFEGAAAPDGPSISPGTISITSRIAVKFRLRP